MAIKELEKLQITEVEEFKYSNEFFTKTFLKIENEKEKESLIDFYIGRSKQVNVYEFFYTSNNHRVKGLLVEPNNLTSPTSTVVYCRGGTGKVGAIQPIHLLSKHLEIFDLVTAGHIVIASQLSGIEGSEGMTDCGGDSDLADILNLYQVFKNYELSNGQFSIIGASNGGALVYKALSATNDFKCAVSVAGKSRESFERTRPDIEKLKFLRHQYFDTDSKEELVKRSALEWTDKFSKTTPILLIHGTNDWRVEVSQTLELGLELYQNKVPFEIAIYEGDDHSISQNRTKANKQIVEWIDKHINPKK